MDKLDYLIGYLLKENGRVDVEIPENVDEKKKLYRALCNVREAKVIDDKYLEIEDMYLKEELEKKNIVDVKKIKSVGEMYKDTKVKNKDKICLYRGDITKLKIEAIVNAANSQGLGCFIPLHSCIDNQIFSNAGTRLRLECNEIMKEKKYINTGEAIITKGYNLPAKYIIHTVGPVIDDEVTNADIEKLSSCYTTSLELASKRGIRSVAFPCISTGVFRFPKNIASKIAVESVDEFLSKNNNRDKFSKVVFNVYSEEDLVLYERIIK